MKLNGAGRWLKRNFGQMVMGASYALMGLGCGIAAAQAADTAGWGMGQLLLVMLAGVYGSILIHIVLHEAGHMIFGLMTGYRFASFRIGSFVWQRTEAGKICFGHSPLPGAAGQCLMSPPELVNGTMPFVLYNLGGVLMNLIIAAASLIAWAAAEHPVADALLIMCALVGVVTAVINGVPMRMGAVDNDGYNILSMKRSGEAVRGLWVQLKIAAEAARDVRLRDMPEEWFYMPSRLAMKNSLCASVGVFHCGQLMDQLKFEEAKRAMQGMLRQNSGMVGLHRASVKMDLAVCELLTGGGQEAAEKTLDPQTKKLMKAMKNHLSAIRTEYVFTLLGEGDEKKAEEILCRFEKAAEKWPSKADVESERELIACAQAKRTETKEKECEGE